MSIFGTGATIGANLFGTAAQFGQQFIANDLAKTTAKETTKQTIAQSQAQASIANSQAQQKASEYAIEKAESGSTLKTLAIAGAAATALVGALLVFVGTKK